MKPLPTIDAALIKVTGVFSFDNKQKKALINAGYMDIPLSEKVPETHSDYQNEQDESVLYYRDTYYSEFSSLMFTGKSEGKSMHGLQRAKEFSMVITLGSIKNARHVEAICSRQELFLFDNGTGIFALSFKPIQHTFEYLSDLIFGLRSFDAKLMFSGHPLVFHEFISKEVLCNIPLRGANVQADDYSGSKFKIYTVINTVEPDDEKLYSRDYLVYEIGTGSRIGTVEEQDYNAPSLIYYEELMQNSIKVFNNYTGLALLDSFTIIGNKQVFQYKENGFYSFNIYNRVYFAIYIYNLFLRYNLFRFNAVFSDNPVKIRSNFEAFVNNYNFSHISFNFLPNIFYKKIHHALGIGTEIEQFEKRLGKLAASIQEDQEKRQAALLGLVSLLTGLSSVNDILNILEKVRVRVNWSSCLFYSSLVILVLFLSVPVLAYLFPENTKKIKRKLFKNPKN
jgi:hypothetical protein